MPLDWECGSFLPKVHHIGVHSDSHHTLLSTLAPSLPGTPSKAVVQIGILLIQSTCLSTCLLAHVLQLLFTGEAYADDWAAQQQLFMDLALLSATAGATNHNDLLQHSSWNLR